MTRIESRGFYMFLGGLIVLLLLRRVYVRIEAKQPKPANVRDFVEVGA